MSQRRRWRGWRLRYADPEFWRLEQPVVEMMAARYEGTWLGWRADRDLVRRQSSWLVRIDWREFGSA